MALLSLSIKRPSSGFLDVPPSPPQSPPVVAEFSPPSPAAASPPTDSPVDGFLRLPPPGSFHAGAAAESGGAPFHPERAAKKRRKQERPSSLSVVEDRNFDDPPPPPSSCVPSAWNDVAPDALRQLADQIPPPLPPPGQDSNAVSVSADVPEGLAASEEELHRSTAVVKPVQTVTEQLPAEATPSTPIQSSMSSLSSVIKSSPGGVGVLALGYPSSPALARVAAGNGTGSDGEGEGSDGGVQETCPECHKVFKRRVYLQRHMAREHWSTAKVFKCDKCAYQTKHQSNLLVHRRTHTGIDNL